MTRLVLKFGGTSVANLERIAHVADIVAARKTEAHGIAVVVSAMAGETDRLVNFCREAAPLHDPREYDVVVASGELRDAHGLTDVPRLEPREARAPGRQS